jgi:hypothetical protein
MQFINFRNIKNKNKSVFFDSDNTSSCFAQALEVCTFYSKLYKKISFFLRVIPTSQIITFSRLNQIMGFCSEKCKADNSYISINAACKKLLRHFKTENSLNHIMIFEDKCEEIIVTKAKYAQFIKNIISYLTTEKGISLANRKGSEVSFYSFKNRYLIGCFL